MERDPDCIYMGNSPTVYCKVEAITGLDFRRGRRDAGIKLVPQEGHVGPLLFSAAGAEQLVSIINRKRREG